MIGECDGPHNQTHEYHLIFFLLYGLIAPAGIDLLPRSVVLKNDLNTRSFFFYFLAQEVVSGNLEF